MHLYYDYDNINVPVNKYLRNAQKTTIYAIPRPRAYIKEALPTSVHRAFLRAIFAVAGGTIMYVIFLRQFLWRWVYAIVGTMYSLSRQSKATGFPRLIGLAGRFFVSGFLLVMLWEMCNTAFTAYARQEPIKRARPLTQDSKDPNGSLLTGLKATKPLVKVRHIQENKSKELASIVTFRVSFTKH